MTPGLIDHLWQSTLFLAVAWLLTLALRKNQAQVRYWVWFTASVKFLIPFSLLVGLGTLVPRRASAPPVPAQWVTVVEQISEPPISLPAVPVAAEHGKHNYVVIAALGFWACGFAAIAMCWLARWKRVQTLRRLATPVKTLEFRAPVMSVPDLIEPGIFGIIRPVLLLPEGIEDRLDRAQLDAILAHELCHVRRRDNLTATIHMMVQAIFWFHPLVWWLGARLVDERERACDEEVLRIFGQPKVYADGILNVCKLYVESRLACVSGVTGSNLKRRIEAIMKNRVAARLNFAKKTVLAIAGGAALAVPIVVGVMNAPYVRAQSAPASIPKWEVVSVRPVGPVDEAHCVGGGASPSRLLIPCNTLAALIRTAYFTFVDGHRNSAPLPPRFSPISGGPAWLSSDHWQISAKTEGNVSQEMMRGPMLQTLLEDRFRLKVHRETRQVPVYALIAAKGGPKLRQFEKGNCIPIDPMKVPAPPPPGQAVAATPGQRYCGSRLAERKGSNVKLGFTGTSLDTFAKLLSSMMDRPVIDKTGILELFDFELEFAPDETTPGSPALPSNDPDRGPSILTAVQQLGLKLDPTKGPGEFLVVDHVERPSEN